MTIKQRKVQSQREKEEMNNYTDADLKIQENQTSHATESVRTKTDMTSVECTDENQFNLQKKVIVLKNIFTKVLGGTQFDSIRTSLGLGGNNN